MNTLMSAKRQNVVENIYPQVMVLPDYSGDFEPDLHRARLLIGATEVFGEYMTTKTSNTADAQQKRK